MPNISYGRQTVEDDDIEALIESVRSGWLTQGFHVEAFEDAIAGYCGSRYAVACCNGTAATHLAYLAAGIGGGDAIITSPNTFVATANAALYAGAKPYLADIDPNTLNIDPARIEERIENKTETASSDINNACNAKLKAIVPVHFAGLPCDMEAISDIARQHNLVIVEDACHALGAKWRDSSGNWHKVGDCSHSQTTVFSFHPVKSITTGEGGVITTNDRDIYERLMLFRSHGITKDHDNFVDNDMAFTDNESNPWYYEMQELGFNYRITDMQCALGMAQLKKIDRFTDRRREIVAVYDRLLADYPVIKLPVTKRDAHSSNHLYPVQIAFDEIGIARSRWMKRMAGRGIALQVHYIPVHLQPYYRSRFGYKEGDFPASEAYYEQAVSLPIYPLLTDDDIHHIVECMIEEMEMTK